jgi:hypothetical protein
VNGSIIQTALTNKTLRLELVYRPATLPEDNAHSGDPAMGPASEFQFDGPKPSGEFACLLEMI